MAIKKIKERERVTETYYTREFRWKDDPSGGFSFPCDENGRLFDDLTDAAKANYESALKNDKLEDLGIQKRTHSYIEPAIGKCDCGCENRMEDQTNGYAAFQCEGCGQWYNISGQELLPPDQWDLGDERD